MAAACSAAIFFLAPTSSQHLIKSPSESKRWAREEKKAPEENSQLQAAFLYGSNKVAS